MDGFHPATRTWFEASFAQPTAAQQQGWPAIAAGGHVLIHAPTGSGKTLAAFLWAIDQLFHLPVPPRSERCRALYVSPLKALAYDIERNLRAPLAGIRHAAQRLGYELPETATFMRTGDTPQEERRAMQRNPPDILITTPESLYLLLTSEARAVLRTVRWVIVDEVHAVAGSKRGAHLALSLERLETIVASPPQRIGLSATQRPLETIGLFLGGCDWEEEVVLPRPVKIIDAASPRPLQLEVVVPVEDMTAPLTEDPLGGPPSQSIWPAVYPQILARIQEHRSTIVFANSRRLAERICAEINNLAGEEIARAHHGSVAREQRVQIEEALKRGDLKAVVATSSLELGIDMGAVDLVIQVEAPQSVASGLQRVGRSGHQVGGVSRAVLYPKYRGDLLVSTVVAGEMQRGAVEATVIPANPLDVLAQQLVATTAVSPAQGDDLYRMVRKAAPFRELSRSLFDATLDLLSGRYPSDAFAELRPRINWDRAAGMVSTRPGARQLAIANAGTIPDRGLFRVALPDGTRVGELDEEMVYESRVGDAFLLGASTWRITDIGPDRVEVIPAPGAVSPRMPYWHGDMAGRPVATGRAVGRFTRRLGALANDEALTTLQDEWGLDELAAGNLIAYVRDEQEMTGLLPTDSNLVVERFRDEIGDWRVVLLSPLGAKVHAPWAMAITEHLRDRFEVDVVWSDDGIAFRFPDAGEVPGAEDFALDPDEAERLVIEHLGSTAMFAARFRQAAGRALLLPRRRPGSRTPLWLQRRRAADLLAVAKQYGDFPIILEVYREILQDDFDLPALREVLADISARRVRLTQVDTPSASPFAQSLLFSFVASYLYEGDAPAAERRAAALTLDRGLLAELLGEGELRDLISPDVVAAVELELQMLTAERHATNHDDLHDLLRRLGPVSLFDIEVRSTGLDVGEALPQLERERRVIQVRVAGRDCWAAIEDAARLRDALGVSPPVGVPFVFLEPVADPLGDVINRYARTHGPFVTSDVADALGLPAGVVDTVLHQMESHGRVLQGAFRPGGAAREWVEVDVLRRLKRRSLAALRKEIEPVDGPALGRFLPAWQQIGPSRGRRALLDAVNRLQGASIPASSLERDVLGARVVDPAPLLDSALMEGNLIWVGRGPLGSSDGRVALYYRAGFQALAPLPPEIPDGPIPNLLYSHLRERGASFFPDLYQSAGGGDPQSVGDALWDLVWAGLVTNDSYAPVRAFLRGRHARRPGMPSLRSGTPPDLAGRWSLVSSERADPLGQATAWAEVLLDRHGVVTRSAVASEGLVGGFSGIYPVFSHLEEIGRVRRGYFVEGLGGAQFALPGAVDRLRSQPAAGLIGLAATDPAHPYGAALSWPDIDSGRIGRLPNAYVVLAEGELVAFVDGKRIRLFTNDPNLYHPIAGVVGELASRHRRFLVERVDDRPVNESPVAHALLEAGFSQTPKGLAVRR